MTKGAGMRRGERACEARLIGTPRRDRRALLGTTALQATFLVVLAVPAMAQAPNARPTGGQVVAGGAAISQTSNNTLITQSTQRGVVQWQSFNVGSQQSVTFAQPSTTSSTLNRVIGGDPSAIAGKITANGQIVISNQAGVIFSKGSEVDTAGLIATSANITNPNFMNGTMVFDGAGNPNARVVNRGTITVHDAGLVGLISPRVANSGVIDAKLGHVVIAGAATATLDMYGDGLLSIDVTKQVVQVPTGRNGKPATALVTNTGTIRADGGTVQITAAAADGIVDNLVNAGGTIAAGGGVISIAGTGGSVRVDGALLANGGAAGVGGAIAVNATGAVTLANGARLSANGAAGGGTVAIGTTLARAAGGPSVASAQTAKQVVVLPGATISADARKTGRGGDVVLLSTDSTYHGGVITARGGGLGGNGGTVEISGATIGLSGSVDVSAAHGTPGTILLDPVDLVIGSQGTETPGATDPNVPFDTNPNDTAPAGTITPASLANLTGNVHVEATNNITVNSAVAITGNGTQNFTLEAGNSININAPVSASGSLYLYAGSPNAPGGGVATGSITVASGISLAAGGDVTLSAPGGITLNSFVAAGGSVTLTTPLFVANGVTQSPAGSLTINSSVSAGTFDSISLLADNIAFTSNAQLSVSSGTIIFSPVTAGRPIELIGSGTPNANALSLNYNRLTDVIISAATVDLGAPPATPGGTPIAGPINIGNGVDDINMNEIGGDSGFVSVLGLYSRGAVTQAVGSGITVDTIQGQAASVALTSSSNSIFNIGSFTTTNDFSLTTNAGGDPTVTGPVTAVNGNVTITTSFDLGIEAIITGGTVQLNASGPVYDFGSVPDGVTATLLSSTANSFSLQALSNGRYVNNVGTLGNIPNASNVTFENSSNLTIAGTIHGTDYDGIKIGAAGNLTLAATSVLNAGTANLTQGITLEATGAIAQAQGSSIQTHLLNASANGISLISTANQIAYPQTISGGTGGVAITDSTAMQVIGTISVGTGQTITLTDDGITLNANTGPQGPSTPALDAPAGLVVLAPLTAGKGLQLIVLGETPDASALAITNQALGYINTSVGTAAASGTLQLGSATTGAITIGTGAGDLFNLQANVATLSLVNNTTAAATELGGLVVNALTGNTGAATITGTGGQPPGPNQIGTLGAYTTTGNFTLTDSGNLAITGPVTVAQGYTGNVSIETSGTISVSGNIASGANTSGQYSLILNSTGGAITQTAGTINGASVLLEATGNISQAGTPAIDAGIILTAQATGSTSSVLLNSPNNAIGDVGDFGAAPTNTAGATFSVTSNEFMQVGTITATNVTLDAPGMQIFGPITATNLVLSSAGGEVFDFAGTIDLSGTLSGTVESANLPSSSDSIATIGSLASSGIVNLDNGRSLTVVGPFTAQGAITLTNAGPVTVTGTLSGPSISVVANNRVINGVTIAGDINQTAGLINAPAVTLNAAGVINQTGGGINTTGTGTLTGSSGGTTSLLGPNNLIGTLGAFSSVGGFELEDTASLTIAGPATDTAVSVITTTGANSDITITGTLSAPFISLNAVRNITEPGGVLSGQTLAASTTSGSIDLPSANNSFTTIDFSSAGTSLSVTDSVPLTIDAPIHVGANSFITITDDTPSFGPQGVMTAIGGTVTFQPLTAIGLIVGGTNNIGATPPVTANELVIGSATATGVNVSGSFNLTNVATLDLISSGAIFQSGDGSIAVGSLLASAGTTGGITLNSVNNRIGTLGAVSAGGDITIDNATPLTLSGSIASTNGTILIAADTITLNTTASLVAPNGNVFLGPLFDGDAQTVAGGSGTGAGASQVTTNVLELGGYILGATTIEPSSLAITGAFNFSGASSFQLISGGAIAESGAGAINAQFVHGQGGPTTLNGPNIFTAFSTFFSTGGLSVRNTAPLIVNDVADDTFATFNVAGSITLTGDLSAPTLSLNATNAITQIGGTINAPTLLTGSLTGAGSGVALNLANTVGTLGAFPSSGNFSLTDAAPLTIAGAVSAGGGTPVLTITDDTPSFGSQGFLSAIGGTVALAPYTANTLFAIGGGGAIPANPSVSASTLTIGSPSTGTVQVQGALNLTSVSTLNLVSGGAVAEIGGAAVSVGTLAASGTTITLNGANTIDALGAIDYVNPGGATLSATSFSLTNSGPLVLTGVLNATTATLSNATGVISQIGTGGLDTGTISGAALAVQLNGGNTLATLGAFMTTNGFTLADGAGLSVTGPIQASTVTLTAGGSLAIAGDLVAPGGAVSLGAAGAITEAGGITAATLTGAAASANFTGAGNSVATLGSFATSSGFQLVDGIPLTIAGPVTDTNGGVSLIAPGALTLSGSISGPVVSLVATNSGTLPGNITQSGSTAFISGGTLTGAAGGTVSITVGASITTLGSFTSVGGFSLADDLASGQMLTQTGLLSDLTAIAINTSNGGINFTGSVSAPSVSLSAVGAITQSGGGIDAGTLAAGSSGAIALTSALNTITTLASAGGSGGVAITDATPLTVTGAVATNGTNNITITDDAPTLAAGGALSASNATVTLQPLTANALFAVGGGSGLGASPDVLARELVLGSATTGTLAVAGALNLGNTVGTISLVSGGAVTETGAGAIATSAGVVDATGAVVTLGGTNSIATLGTVVSAGTFALLNTSALSVAGPVTVGGGASLDIGGALTLAGNFSATPSTTLIAAGAVTQSGGTLATGTLTASATGLSLNESGNSIGALGAITVPAPGNVSIVDASGLTVAGTLDPANVTLNVTGPLTIANVITASNATLVANGALGAITEVSPGLLNLTGTLTGAAASAALTQPNAIATLGAFTTAGGFALTDAVPVTVAATVTAGGTGQALRLTDDSPTFATGGLLSAAGGTVALAPFTNNTLFRIGGGGGLTGAPSVAATTLTIGSATTGTVDVAGALNLSRVSALNLISGGNVTETGTGAFSVGTISASGANIMLTGANAVGVIGSVAATGAFSLTSSGPLTVSGPVGAGTAINLDVTDALSLSGNLSAPNVNLSALGAITQTAGAITASGTLGAHAAGIALTQPNSISALGTVVSTGGFALTDTVPLTIGAVVATGGIAPTLVINDDNPSFGPGGVLDAISGNVNDGGVVTLRPFTSGGSLTIGGGNGIFGSVAAATDTLVLGSSTTSAVTINGALNLLGATDVYIASTGAISEGPNGGISAIALAGTGSTISLPNTNAITTLGSLNATGAITIADSASLAVSGPVNAGKLTITTPGGITFTGTTTATTLNLFAGGQITQPGGTITTSLLTGTANGLAQFGPDAAGPIANVGTLGSFTVGNTGTLTLADNIPLTIQGPLSAAYLGISAPSSITLNGGTIATTGLPFGQQSGTDPSRPGSYLLVTPDPTTDTGSFTQTGISSVSGLNGGAATLRIQVPDNGTVRFADLDSPNLNLVLDAGTGGTALGSVTLNNLLVLGQGGATTLTGIVADQQGVGAAAVSFINPAVNTAYTLNNCPIESTACISVNLNISAFSELAPKSFLRVSTDIILPLLTLDVVPDPNDPDLLLPNISAEDY
jgi:filamentous hemagglutinin family protein